MKKEFVVKSIDAAPDGAPYVIVSLSSIKDLKAGTQSQPSPFGSPKVMGFSNMGDMMKDLNKMMSGMGRNGNAKWRYSIKTRNARIQRHGSLSWR